MGAFLHVGLTVNVEMWKRENFSNTSIHNMLKYENFHFDMYDLEEDEKKCVYRIKKEYFADSKVVWDFLSSQYHLLGVKDKETQELRTEILKLEGYDEIYKLADEEISRFFYISNISYIQPPGDKEMICFYNVGKILMEEEGNLFRYFTNMLRRQSTKYLLAGALEVWKA